MKQKTPTKKLTNSDNSIQKRGAKALRNEVIVSKAMAGQTTTQIAKELDISRATVSKVLNSVEISEKVKTIEGRLALGIDDAIATILDAVKRDPKVARLLLQNFGSFANKSENERGASLEAISMESWDKPLLKEGKAGDKKLTLKDLVLASYFNENDGGIAQNENGFDKAKDPLTNEKC